MVFLFVVTLLGWVEHHLRASWVDASSSRVVPLFDLSSLIQRFSAGCQRATALARCLLYYSAGRNATMQNGNASVKSDAD